ncbi:hypothetical protein [Azospirillum soli]|uniref:hypothetical protein n=1 Tax=Azospirillum soli TaxID=1304799 RepID=UPI001AE74B8E|nr:hypothetical protein [Azospirillum soli]MBP2315802.1 hypothetical protein [Azospirillum soli]
MVAVPDPQHSTTRTASRPAGQPAGGVPRLLDMLGIGAFAGGGLAGVLLLVQSPFDGPWRVVLAVAVVFASIYAGFLMIGFAANLRELEAVRRCLALVARRQGDRGLGHHER